MPGDDSAPKRSKKDAAKKDVAKKDKKSKDDDKKEKKTKTSDSKREKRSLGDAEPALNGSSNGHAAEEPADVHRDKRRARSSSTSSAESPLSPEKLAAAWLKELDDDGNLPLSSTNLNPLIISNLATKQIRTLFPIQHRSLPYLIEGCDMLGRARTGTGKTLAFAVPTIERLLRSSNGTTHLARGRAPRVLVMVPTRELAIQVHNDFAMLAAGTSLTTVVCYGGTAYDTQVRAMREGLDVLVGTPGRIQDLAKSGTLKMSGIEVVVLDEADEMLKQGFQEIVEEILGLVPTDRPHQTMLFSATCPPWVKTLLAKHLRPDFKTVDLVTGTNTQSASKVRHLAICCHWKERAGILADVVRVYGGSSRTIVFTNTKAEANELATSSSLRNVCEVLHGDISQAQREITMNGFREGKFSCLVATDVAARGLDINGVGLIIQTQPPKDIEAYVHRSGRTGRAGRSGINIVFYQRREDDVLQHVERRTGVKFERIGIPQAADLIRMAAEESEGRIAGVHPMCVDSFLPTAQSLLAADGADPVRVLAAALAVVAGFEQPPTQRSLLSSVEGFVTMRISAKREIFSPSFVLRLLADDFGIENKDVRDIALTTDGGAVVDVSKEASELIMAEKPNRLTAAYQWDVATELPPLKERNRSGPSGGGFGGGGGGSFHPGSYNRGSPRGGSGGGGSFGRSRSSSSSGFGSATPKRTFGNK